MADNNADLILSFIGEQKNLQATLGGIIKGIDGLDKKLKGLEETAKKTASLMETGMNKAAAGIASSFKKIVAAAGIAGIAASFSKAIKSAREFETGMRKIGFMLGDEGVKNIQGYKNAVLDMSKASDNSIKELTGGMQKIVQSGVKGTETLEGATKMLQITSDAASATMGDTGEVAKVMGMLMNAYGKSLEDAAGMSDALVVASRKSGIGIGEMGGMLTRIAPQAKSLGISMEDLVSALVAMRKSGIEGRQAMMTLQSLMGRLAHPSLELAKVLGGVKDGSGLAGILEAVREKAKGSAAEMNKMIPGGRSMAGMATLLGAGFDKFKVSLEEINDAMHNTRNESKDYADQMENTFGGKLQRFKNNVEALYVSLGQMFLPVLSSMIEGLLEGASAFDKAINAMANYDKMLSEVGRQKGIAEKEMATTARILGIGPESAWGTSVPTGAEAGGPAEPLGSAKSAAEEALKKAREKAGKEQEKKDQEWFSKLMDMRKKLQDTIDSLAREGMTEQEKLDAEYDKKRKQMEKDFRADQKGLSEALHLLETDHIRKEQELRKKAEDELFGLKEKAGLVTGRMKLDREYLKQVDEIKKKYADNETQRLEQLYLLDIAHEKEMAELKRKDAADLAEWRQQQEKITEDALEAYRRQKGKVMGEGGTLEGGEKYKKPGTRTPYADQSPEERKSSLEQLKQQILPGFVESLDYIKGKYDNLEQTAKEQFEGVAKEATLVILKIQRVMDVLATVAPEFTKLFGVLDAIPDLLAGNGPASLIMGMVKGVGEALGLDKLFDMFFNMLGGLGETLKNAGMGWIRAIVDLVSRALQGGGMAFLHNIVAQVVKLLVKLRDNIGPMLNYIIREAIPQIVDAVIDAIPAIIKAIISNIPYLVYQIVRAVVKLIAKLFNPFSWFHEGGVVSRGDSPQLAFAGAYHQGGIVVDAVGRFAEAAGLFANAARAHGGMNVRSRLGPDEVPIIAKAGEAVMTSDWVKNAGGAAAVDRMNKTGQASGGTSNTVVINAQHVFAKDSRKVIDEMIGENVRQGVGKVRKLASFAVPGFKPNRG